MNVTDRDQWSAFHVFLHDRAKCEQWMVNQLFPLVRQTLGAGAARSWFFVRYWEGGPHVRIRFKGLSPADGDRLAAQLKASCEGYGADRPLTRADYYANHTFDGEQVSDADLPWFNDTAVARIAYAPEWQRYGGPAAMAINEALFSVSSELAAGLIAAPGATIAVRLAKAQVVIAAMIRAVGLPVGDTKRFAAGYYQTWAGYSPTTRAQAAQRQFASSSPDLRAARADAVFAASAAATVPGGPLERWSQAVVQWADALRALAQRGELLMPSSADPVDNNAAAIAAIGQILFSQIHMTNNRLGITPDLEMHLAEAIAGEALAFPDPAHEPRMETV